MAACPNQGEPLQCPTSSCVSFGVSDYTTKPSLNRLGAFCLPDDEVLAQKLLQQPQISIKNSILDSIDTILLSLLLGLSLGIIFMVLVSVIPKIMVNFVFVGSSIALIFAAIYIFIKPVNFWDQNIWNILLALAFILAAFVFLISMCCTKK